MNNGDSEVLSETTSKTRTTGNEVMPEVDILSSRAQHVLQEAPSPGPDTDGLSTFPPPLQFSEPSERSWPGSPDTDRSVTPPLEPHEVEVPERLAAIVMQQQEGAIVSPSKSELLEVEAVEVEPEPDVEDGAAERQEKDRDSGYQDMSEITIVPPPPPLDNSEEKVKEVEEPDSGSSLDNISAIPPPVDFATPAGEWEPEPPKPLKKLVIDDSLFPWLQEPQSTLNAEIPVPIVEPAPGVQQEETVEELPSQPEVKPVARPEVKRRPPKTHTSEPAVVPEVKSTEEPEVTLKLCTEVTQEVDLRAQQEVIPAEKLVRNVPEMRIQAEVKEKTEIQRSDVKPANVQDLLLEKVPVSAVKPKIKPKRPQVPVRSLSKPESGSVSNKPAGPDVASQTVVQSKPVVKEVKREMQSAQISEKDTLLTREVQPEAQVKEKQKDVEPRREVEVEAIVCEVRQEVQSTQVLEKLMELREEVQPKAVMKEEKIKQETQSTHLSEKDEQGKQEFFCEAPVVAETRSTTSSGFDSLNLLEEKFRDLENHCAGSSEKADEPQNDLNANNLGKNAGDVVVDTKSSYDPFAQPLLNDELRELEKETTKSSESLNEVPASSSDVTFGVDSQMSAQRNPIKPLAEETCTITKAHKEALMPEKKAGTCETRDVPKLDLNITPPSALTQPLGLPTPPSCSPPAATPPSLSLPSPLTSPRKEDQCGEVVEPASQAVSSDSSHTQAGSSLPDAQRGKVTSSQCTSSTVKSLPEDNSTVPSYHPTGTLQRPVSLPLGLLNSAQVENVADQKAGDSSKEHSAMSSRSMSPEAACTPSSPSLPSEKPMELPKPPPLTVPSLRRYSDLAAEVSFITAAAKREEKKIPKEEKEAPKEEKIPKPPIPYRRSQTTSAVERPHSWVAPDAGKRSSLLWSSAYKPGASSSSEGRRKEFKPIDFSVKSDPPLSTRPNTETPEKREEHKTEAGKPVVASGKGKEVTKPAVVSGKEKEVQVTKPAVVSGMKEEVKVTKPAVTSGMKEEVKVTKPAVVFGMKEEVQVTKPVVVSGKEEEVQVTKPAATFGMEKEMKLANPAVTSDKGKEEKLLSTKQEAKLDGRQNVPSKVDVPSMTTTEKQSGEKTSGVLGLINTFSTSSEVNKPEDARVRAAAAQSNKQDTEGSNTEKSKPSSVNPSRGKYAVLFPKDDSSKVKAPIVENTPETRGGEADSKADPLEKDSRQRLSSLSSRQKYNILFAGGGTAVKPAEDPSLKLTNERASNKSEEKPAQEDKRSSVVGGTTFEIIFAGDEASKSITGSKRQSTITERSKSLKKETPGIETKTVSKSESFGPVAEEKKVTPPAVRAKPVGATTLRENVTAQDPRKRHSMPVSLAPKPTGTSKGLQVCIGVVK